MWKGISIGKAAFSLFGWLLFSIFVKEDKTCESLETRDFNILDEFNFAADSSSQQATNITTTKAKEEKIQNVDEMMKNKSRI